MGRYCAHTDPNAHSRECLSVSPSFLFTTYLSARHQLFDHASPANPHPLFLVPRLNMIIVKSSVDHKEQLASMFGLQQTCSSIARGIAPAAVSALFAISIDRQIMGTYFVWVVLVLISLIAIPLSLRVRDVPAPRSQVIDEDDGYAEAQGSHDTAAKPLPKPISPATETRGSRSPLQ